MALDDILIDDDMNKRIREEWRKMFQTVRSVEADVT